MTLKLAQIEKRYGDRVLLSIESLEIDHASCILITGENGAGKTTLLQILAGLLEPERCWVTDQGVTVSWRKARARFLKMVVYVHQTAYMFDRTVAENVAYGLKARKVPKEEIEQQVADALRWARLDHLAYRNARLLSDGEKQRIALTRAKVVDAEGQRRRSKGITSWRIKLRSKRSSRFEGSSTQLNPCSRAYASRAFRE